MPIVHRTPSVTLTASPTRGVSADLLVVPVFEDDDLGEGRDLDAATSGELGRARARGEFRGKPFEVFATTISAEGWSSTRVAVVGAGCRADASSARLRRVGVVAGLWARQRRLATMAITVPAAVDAAMAIQALAEGVVMANYEGASYKTAGDPPVWLDRVQFRTEASGDDVTAALARGLVLGECTNLSRELSNEPASTLTPRVFADRATAIAVSAGLGVEVLDEAQIADLKMGMLLGVARGSVEPPRVIVLRHEPKDAVKGVVLGLVGKGITFDTGGISIKPADNMDKMKNDMSGGAAVICAMAAMARLKAPVACIGVIPATENMPGGRAVKPGDILTSAEGKTVEVINTDAEGRLILGDGLWYARRLGATHLVDVATLTGACVVALGKTTSGLFGTPDAWVEQVRLASERAGDRTWRMPIFEDYAELLKSEIADFTNTGGRAGGSITAALFIKEFTGGLPWVHMDIAGTSWAEDAKPYQPRGATGVAVRTLAELALAAAAWAPNRA